MDDLGFGKKKKKKKAKEGEGEGDGAPGAADDAMGEVDELGELKLKKKKKKKTLDDGELGGDGDDGEADGGDAGGCASGLPWANSTRDYHYEEMLGRVFGILRENNPELAGEKHKTILKPPQVLREGTKKTVFVNFSELCKAMHRAPDHVITYLLAELGTSGSLDGQARLIVKGRFLPKVFEGILRRYINDYVICNMCKSADTLLHKENRLYILRCQAVRCASLVPRCRLALTRLRPACAVRCLAIRVGHQVWLRRARGPPQNRSVSCALLTAAGRCAAARLVFRHTVCGPTTPPVCAITRDAPSPTTGSPAACVCAPCVCAAFAVTHHRRLPRPHVTRAQSGGAPDASRSRWRTLRRLPPRLPLCRRRPPTSHLQKRLCSTATRRAPQTLSTARARATASTRPCSRRTTRQRAPRAATPATPNPDATQRAAAARRFVLAAERVYEERTAVFHQQCADSLCPVTPSVIALGRESRQLSLLDTTTGAILDTSNRLPFSVYGLAVDESGWLAAAGNERTEEHYNCAALRLQPTEDGGSVRLDASTTRTYGVGRLSRGSRNQANSVRFGCSRQQRAPPAVATVRVLLVGSQDSSVYVYALPAAGEPPASTRALVQHRFETAVNCAAASPDGRWLAATGDTEALYVVGSDAGFLDAATCERFTLRFTHRPRLMHEQAGSQYCAWSADGQRLAASSDTLHAVAVWAVPPPGAPTMEFVPLARFAEFARPALALTFLPPTADGSHLLAWSELDSNVYVADVDFAGAQDAWARPLLDSCGEREMRARGVQRIRLPPPAAPPELLLAPAAYLNRITGLCCAGNALYVAQTARITKFPILAAWSKEQHAHFPVAFRRAVRTLLLGAAQSTPTDESTQAAPLLACIPKEIVVQIIALAAAPRACWLPARLSQAAEDERFFAKRERRNRIMVTDDEDDDDDEEMPLAVSSGEDE